MIVADPPTPVRALRSDVPHGLEGVILRCLEKEPSSRYPTVADFAQALKPFALPDGREAVDRITRTLARSAPRAATRGAMIHVGPVPSATRPPPLPQPPLPEFLAPRRAGGYLGLALGLGGVAIGALLTLAVLLMERGESNTPEARANAAELALQREIVKEISALRAQREDDAARLTESREVESENQPTKRTPVRSRAPRAVPAHIGEPAAAAQPVARRGGQPEGDRAGVGSGDAASKDLFSGIH
jgi:serine/threonine-protein kinase